MEMGMHPAHYYRMQNGILEQKLFADGICPDGWYDDKFKARDKVQDEPEYYEKRIIVEKIKHEPGDTVTASSTQTDEGFVVAELPETSVAPKKKRTRKKRK